MSALRWAPDASHPHKRRRRRAQAETPNIHLPLLLLVLALLISPSLAATNCLRFADYDSINQLLSDGGPGTKVLLCPSKTYRLSGTIVFTAADQEVATFGYPIGNDRAVIRIENANVATIIQGDCKRCARVGIRSLIIDGNRPKLGRFIQGESTGLVVLGGNEGQSVKQSIIRHPRGFTALHFREGSQLQCSGAVIEKNEIGPVGEEYDPDVDGPDPEMTPHGRPLADGLSIACKDSTIRDNTFFDNTASSIVIYCSPGTLVEGNVISARTMSAMAGILAVDSVPFDGDYSKMIIKSNVIDAAGATIRVGIGLGAAVWSDDTETILKGGTVIKNGIKGPFMGFGIAAAGLDGWTVMDNWDDANHQGMKSARCFDEPVNPDPMAMLYYAPSIINSQFQDGFVDQEFQYVVCIDGIEDKANPPKPPAPAPPPPPEEPEGPMQLEATFDTGSEVMNDILEHSQIRMLESIEHLARIMDVKDHRQGQVILHGSSDGAPPSGDVSDILSKLETNQQAALSTFSELNQLYKRMWANVAQLEPWQDDILMSVRERVMMYNRQLDSMASRGVAAVPTPDKVPTDASKAKGKVIKRTSKANNMRFLNKLGLHPAQKSDWDPVFRLILGQSCFVMLYFGVQRFLRRRRHSKEL